jgi:DNA-binding NarL/FixJ family response regulator
MDLRPPVHLLSPWLCRGAITLLHAQPKTGKTYLALAVAVAVSEGKPLLGWEPDKPGKPRRVLYLDAEMPMWLLYKRLRQFGAEHNTGIDFLSREDLLAEGSTMMPDLGSPAGLDMLDRLMDRLQPALVVLDSLSALIRSGIENERESWLPLEAWLQSQRARKRAVLMVHHQGKSGLQRGTSAREEVIDASLALRKHANGALRIEIERIRDHEGEIDRSITARLKFSDDGETARWVRVGRKGTNGHALPEMSETRAKVLTLRRDGLSNPKIARKLKIDRKTVYDHSKALEAQGLV